MTSTIYLPRAVRTVKAVPLLLKAATTMVAAVPVGIAPGKVTAAVAVTVVGTGSAANTTAGMADLAAAPDRVMSAAITVTVPVVVADLAAAVALIIMSEMVAVAAHTMTAPHNSIKPERIPVTVRSPLN
jgi:hypothetical protein